MYLFMYIILSVCPPWVLHGGPRTSYCIQLHINYTLTSIFLAAEINM